MKGWRRLFFATLHCYPFRMATARHPKATFFVQRHLFSGLTSFAGLEQKIAALPDEQSRGAAFEVFAEAYETDKKQLPASA